jgi:putative transposase
MARPLRIQFENAYYHITCRGNSRQKISADDFDRKAFLDLLGRSREIYRVEVLAYVLMTNHFHLLIKTRLCKIMDVGKDEVLRRGQKGYIRGVLMKVLYEYGGLNQREIGELMGVDYSSVSVGRKRLEEEVRKDRVLGKKMAEVVRVITQGFTPWLDL